MYFVTICAHERRMLFGEIQDDKVKLSEVGRVIREEWLRTPQVRAAVELDEFVVMPNHFHAIVIFTHTALVGAHCVRPASPQPRPNDGGARSAPLRPAQSLGSLVAGFKSAVTHRCGQPVWQRNYFEHIIRDEHGLEKIGDYIASNPFRWSLDRENPQRRGVDEFDRWLVGAHCVRPVRRQT